MVAKPLIWIVDDSRTQAALTQHALGSRYRFELFLDGTGLIERLGAATTYPDLILLDWVMPGLSGDEVCRFLRADLRTRELPIVMLTASRIETGDIVLALESGANDYLTKPFIAEELHARVGSILRAAEVKRVAERERRRLASINRLGRALFRAGTDLDVIVAELASALTVELCDGCVVSVHTPDRVVPPVLGHRHGDRAPRLAPFGALAAATTLELASTADAIAALPEPCASYAHDYGIRSLATLPIPLHGPASGSVTLIRDRDGEPFDAGDQVAIEACLDLAGLAIETAIRAEAERATARFHEQMMGIVGHDLRTPLNVVAIGVDLLQHEVRGEVAADVLRRLDNSARRMASIVDQLLDVTRARLGTGIPIARRPAGLRAIAGTVLDELRLAHPAVPFELQGAELHGAWDPDRLAQVIANLVGNAVKYGRTDVPIILELSRSDGAAVLEVRNQNRDAPIPTAQLATLFDPFVRGATARDVAGLGFGLYIVQEIVRAHGGTVAVSSEDDGTSFRVALPLG